MPASVNIEYPDVERWCHYLDGHPLRNKDNIKFTPYASILKEKGFLRIKQLTTNFFKPEDLGRWLDIGVGIAVLIMQYAQEDVEEIRAGRLVIPPKDPQI